MVFSNSKSERISHIIRNYCIETEEEKLSIDYILKSRNPLQFSNKTAVFLDGPEKRYFHIVISSINLDRDTKYVTLLRDITELKQKEENLNLYKTIFENTLDAIGIVDNRGIYVSQNKSNEELLGYTIEEIKDKHFSEVLKIKNPDREWDELKKSGRLRFLGSSVDKSGKEKFFDIVAIAVKDSSGKDRYYVGIKRDITDLIKREKELEGLNRQLKKRLYTDPLTELPNRIKLIEDIKNVASPKLAILNIDDFKEVNDFYGYQVGDFVLKN
ncbi:MAG: PAS domain S-box protein [Persephonella sp.]|nr:PAS domain S-box protein [Persephonella sp.]